MRKYLVLRRKMPFLFLKDTLVDFYAMLFQRRKKHVEAQIPPRILLISFGHLGDALILSYIFPEILRTYPNAKIDVLAGDWCDAIWKNNPYIQRVIHLNHYGTNRKNEGFLTKIGNHFQTTRQAIAELRTKTYDYSIDIRFSGEISHWILPFIKVQKSVGFGTVGFGGLLDKEFLFPKNEPHTYDLMAILLQEIGVKTNVLEVKPYFDYGKESLENIQNKIHFKANLLPFILIFPEAGTNIKELSPDFWLKLVSILAEKNPTWNFIFCGQKKFTSSIVQEITRQNSQNTARFIDGTSQFNINQLAVLAQNAELAFTLDSFPSHLTSIFCRTISFFKNSTGIQFFPIGNQEVLVIHNHQNSKSLTFNRKGFEHILVENFDNVSTIISIVIEKIKCWQENPNVIRKL